ncbi:hypothetical protein BU182_16015, partial [Enterococcus faecium]
LQTFTVQTLEQQSVQAYGQYLSKQTDLEKRIFLMNLFNTNRTLFYKLMCEHLVEFMPVVYDPVVADSIEQYNLSLIQISEPTRIRR